MLSVKLSRAIGKQVQVSKEANNSVELMGKNIFVSLVLVGVQISIKPFEVYLQMEPVFNVKPSSLHAIVRSSRPFVISIAHVLVLSVSRIRVHTLMDLETHKHNEHRKHIPSVILILSISTKTIRSRRQLDVRLHLSTCRTTRSSVSVRVPRSHSDMLASHEEAVRRVPTSMAVRCGHVSSSRSLMTPILTSIHRKPPSVCVVPLYGSREMVAKPSHSRSTLVSSPQIISVKMSERSSSIQSVESSLRSVPLYHSHI